MDFFEIIFKNAIYILFPLLIYVIYLAYRANLTKTKQGFFLEIALFSSLFLLMMYGNHSNEGYYMIFLDIPLFISYFKKKNLTACLISIILVNFMHLNFEIAYPILIVEYTAYFLIYYCSRKKSIKLSDLLNLFVLVKSSVLSFETFFYYGDKSFIINFNQILASVLIFYIGNAFIFYLLDKGEKIVDLNYTIKELEKEKTLRNSLFKITHEIKNPIAVCKGYLDMLDINNQDKVVKYIPIVRNEISRTLTLMDDFLDYTRIKINKDILDVYWLIEDTRNSLLSLLTDKDIKTEFQIPEDELYIMGDYDRLKQVLINIFKNSKEAEATSISLKTKRLKTKLQIIIKDNGVGMDPETLERVGEMFFTTKVKGTGLGIGLSKEIIELHNGTMIYESKFKFGTKVIITLPIEKEINI